MTSAANPADDDWAAALAEQTLAEKPSQPIGAATFGISSPGVPAASPASSQVFQQLADAVQPSLGSMDIGRIQSIPVQLQVELGRTRITIKNLLQLSQGSVVELDGLAGEPLDVLINGFLIAQGEVVVVNEKYGIRLTDIVVPSERIQKLSRG